MAGFRQGGLSLKKRDNGSASDINFVSFYVDSFDRLYSVDTFGTSALVSNQWSTGCIDSDIPELIKTTDNITVPELRVAIFSTPNFRGPLFRKPVSQASFTVPRDGHSKYVVVDYDSGTPYFRIETDIHNVNQSNVVCLYTVWNLNGSIHSILFDNKGEGLANKIDSSIQRTTPYRRSIEGGLILSVDGSRYIHVSDSHVYAGTTEVQISSFTSLTDRITEFYHTSSSWAFPETMSGYQIDNLHFDNGTDLTVANNNKYLCRWIYRTIGDDKEVFVRIGVGEYNSIGDAQKELEPVSPSIVKEHGMLIGRIIIQKGSSTTLVNSIFEFAGGSGSASVSNHNDLSNIQGGDSVNSEYYHLDFERASYLSAVSADVQTQLNDLHMLTSGTGITQIYADSHYLKLDGSNGPITSNLSVLGTLSASSVSATNLTATNIQGTSITVGNVSNVEFQRLDGVSANIQTQFSTLSATKADKSIIISGTNGITGGGDLTQDRTLSLSTVGTSGTFTKVTTDQYGRTISGTSLLASDIPSGIDASKISIGVVSNTEFNFLDGTSANLQNQLSNLSAIKANNVIVSGTSGLIGGGDLLQNRYIGMPNVGTAGTYTKTTTDQYGRVAAGGSLTSADIPTLPATKIGTGIISDTEFNYLDGTSANIQNQLTNLSATTSTKATYSNGADNRIATFTNASNLAGETALTFDGTTLGVGLSANINSPVIIIKQNPGQAGGGEIRIGAAGILSDENSGKLYLPGFRLIGLTNSTFKHQRYNNTTSAYETVFGIESANTANKDVTFRGDYLTISATNPRLVIDGPVGNSKGIRFNDAGSIRWYTGTLQNNSFVIQDGMVNDFPVSVLSGATGTVTIGTSTRKINIPNLTTSAVVVTDGSKNLVSSSITTTELGYLYNANSNIQTQINNILNGTTGKFTSAISIIASVGQIFTITHNLGYMRPFLKLVDETAHQEIMVSPNYISTTQLSFSINSRVARTVRVMVQI